MRDKMPKILWLEVDIKNKELPRHVADSAEELAEICGVTVSTVKATASRQKRGARRRFVKVWIGGN